MIPLKLWPQVFPEVYIKDFIRKVLDSADRGDRKAYLLNGWTQTREYKEFLRSNDFDLYTFNFLRYLDNSFIEAVDQPFPWIPVKEDLEYLFPNMREQIVPDGINEYNMTEVIFGNWFYSIYNTEIYQRKAFEELYDCYKSNNVPIYRGMHIGRIDEFKSMRNCLNKETLLNYLFDKVKKDRFGLYWSYDKRKAESYDAQEAYNKLFFKFSTVANHEAIDWPMTFFCPCLYGSGEKEIRLYRGSELTLYKIYFENEEYVCSPDSLCTITV